MNKIKILLQMLQKLNAIVPVKYKRKMPLLFTAMLLASVLEMLGIAVIIPFMNTLTDYQTFMSDNRVQVVMKFFHIDNFYELLIFMTIAVIFVYLLKNITLLLCRNYQNIIQCSIQSSLSEELLENFIMKPYSSLLKINSAETLTEIFKDSECVYQILYAFLNLLGESVAVLMITVFIFVTEPFLAICLVFLALFSVILIVQGLKHLSIQTGVKHRNSYNKMYQTAIQTVGGIKEISVTGRKKYFINKFKKERNDFKDTQITGNLINLIPERLVEILFISGIVIGLVFRVKFGLDVRSSIVSLSVFAVAGYRLLPSINKFSTNITSLMYYQPSLDNTFRSIIESRKAEKERLEYVQAHSYLEQKSDDLHFENTLEIKDVSFSYSSETRLILSDINLSISKGTSIALIGESGAGKSTLSDIILGLLMPQKGNIFMDGIDIFTIPSNWCKIVGYVPQSVFLLDASIKDNIAFGIKEKDINLNKIRDVLEKVKLSDFVKSLPDGIDTFVGERGTRLSGGQRQRIAIARALYNDPEIMILDEATSALDNETELGVMDAIDALHGHCTLIIIAHRLSTISGCDEIYEIKDGKAINRNKAEVLNNAK